MNALDARLLQCSAGGPFNDMTPSEVRALIETMAEGNQGRGGRMGQVNMTSTVDLKAMESRITQNFETRFSQMLKAVGAKIEPRKCEFCGDTNHATDECDRLQKMSMPSEAIQTNANLSRKPIMSHGRNTQISVGRMRMRRLHSHNPITKNRMCMFIQMHKRHNNLKLTLINNLLNPPHRIPKSLLLTKSLIK